MNLKEGQHSLGNVHHNALCHLLLLMLCLLTPKITVANEDDRTHFYSDISFKRLLHGEGLREGDNINGVTSIIQDRHGYMWFTGESGVALYNGIEFEIFQKKASDPNSLSGSYSWAILEDHDGVIWVATDEGLNRFNPEGHNFTRFTVESAGEGVTPNAGLSTNTLYSLALGDDNTIYIGAINGLYQLNPNRTAFSSISELSGVTVQNTYVDPSGGLWVGASNKGLLYRKSKTAEFETWSSNPKDPNSLPAGYVRAIEADKDGNIWVGTFGSGVARLSADRKQFKRYQHIHGNPLSLASNNIWDIHSDKDGNIWIATDPGGLTLYDPSIDAFHSYKNSPFNPRSLISDKVRSIYDDHIGDLWVGVFPAGVNYFDKSTALFENKSSIPDDANSLSNDIILTLFEDSKKRLWVGTEEGLNLYDMDKQTFTRYLAKPDDPSAMQSDSVLAVAESGSGELWVGTWSGGAYRFNPDQGVFKQYMPDVENPNSLGDAYVWTILNDSEGRVWMGTERTGLSLYRPETDDFVVFRPDPSTQDALSYQHVWALLEDSKKRIWVATTKGLNLLKSVDGNRAHFQHFWHDPENDHTLSSNRIISLMEDKKGNIWVGTQDAGLNKLNPSTGEVFRISISDGLPSGHISSIIEDDKNNIWVTTVHGIAKIDPLTMRIRTFTESNGLVSNNFNRNATFKDSSGKLFLGGSKGLSIVDPKVFNETMRPPEVVLSKFRLFNKPIYVNNNESPLSKPIGETNQIVIQHKQSMFSIEFFAVSYRASHLNQHSYKLEGFDNHWNNVSTNVATYTNLDPGEYTFHVRAANSEGVWNTQGKSLKIIVVPPFWNTKFAYLIYMLVFALSILGLLQVQKKKVELQTQKALNRKLLKIDRIKDAFLANTSHELRTPLNGIIGLAESLQDGSMGAVTPHMKHSLKMISTSGRRLSNLINDILDYSKLHENKLTVRLRSVNLGVVANIVVELLAPLVGAKNLKIINDVPHDVYVVADEDRLQQILLNLVGNAVKFTAAGFVRIASIEKQSEWHISVEDTGPGISPDDLEHIFHAFIQLDNKETREQGGTGLGLSISKQLVEVQGGQLQVESNVGTGSVFTFNMPKGSKIEETVTPTARNATAASTKIVQSRDSCYLDIEDAEDGISLLKPGSMCALYKILIVDDDAVNRLVLSGILSLQNYTVIEAESGVEALKILASGIHVDMVIMDVMMPKMSGYETCMRLRVSYPVHVLPVLFLTAKYFNADIVRGFVSGGSDFLKKPVSKHDLLSRVSTHLSMLEINRRLESKYLEAQEKNLNNGRELSVLEHIVDVINREIDFKRLLKELLNDVKRLIDADQVIYWQAKGENSESSHYSVLESNDDELNEICLYNGEYVIQHLNQLYCEGHKVIILDNLRASDFAFVTETFPESKHSILMTIFFEREIVGFITVLMNDHSRHFGQDTIETLNRLHAHITSAIVKAKLLERLDMDVSELRADGV